MRLNLQNDDFRGQLTKISNLHDDGTERKFAVLCALVILFNTSNASAQEPQHDQNDVVAQVLNYSNFGRDAGATEGAAWYRVDKCRYRMSVDGKATSREIDLNGLDPKNIEFDSIPERYIGKGTTPGGGVNVLYNGDVFIHGDANDIDRVERGWSLIYSKYCKGKEDAFSGSFQTRNKLRLIAAGFPRWWILLRGCNTSTDHRGYNDFAIK